MATCKKCNLQQEHKCLDCGHIFCPDCDNHGNPQCPKCGSFKTERSSEYG